MTQLFPSDIALTCLSCQAPVAHEDKKASCASCGLEYPKLGSTYWAYRRPDVVIAQWQARAQVQLAQWNQLENECKATNDPLGGKRTQRFLQNLVEHRKAFQKVMNELLALNINQDVLLTSLGSRVAASQSFISYARNLARDWAWDEQEPFEVKATETMMKKALEKIGPVKNILVLGAGACRFPAMIHEYLKPQATVCLDINPWLLWSGLRILQGKSMNFAEFPLAPTNENDHAVWHKVSRKPVEGIYGILADVKDMPFGPGSFDLVVTPWLLDILQNPVQETMTAINHILAPGGRYFNFGSLAFPGSRPSEWHDYQAVQSIMADAGFATKFQGTERLPYLCSPYSSQWRHEVNTYWVAEKTRDVPKIARERAQMAWLQDENEPIPVHPRFNELFSQASLYMTILSQVNGQVSLAELAAFLEVRLGLPSEIGKSLIADFLQTAIERDTMQVWNN